MIRIADDVKIPVDISGIKPEMLLGLMIFDAVLQKYNVDCVITAVRDGNHSRGSLHYVGFAVDLRSRDLSEDQKLKVIKDVMDRIGNQFDLVLHKTHFHLEFQPK